MSGLCQITCAWCERSAYLITGPFSCGLHVHYGLNMDDGAPVALHDVMHLLLVVVWSESVLSL